MHIISDFNLISSFSKLMLQLIQFLYKETHFQCFLFYIKGVQESEVQPSEATSVFLVQFVCSLQRMCSLLTEPHEVRSLYFFHLCYDTLPLYYLLFLQTTSLGEKQSLPQWPELQNWAKLLNKKICFCFSQDLNIYINTSIIYLFILLTFFAKISTFFKAKPLSSTESTYFKLPWGVTNRKKKHSSKSLGWVTKSFFLVTALFPVYRNHARASKHLNS